MPKKTSSVGFRKGEYTGRRMLLNLGLFVNQSWARAARWKLTLSQITTQHGCRGCAGSLWSSRCTWSRRPSRKASRCMVLYGPRMADGNTYVHILASLARDIHNGPMANYVHPPSPPFGEMKSCLINKGEFMRSVSGISIRDSLQKRWNTAQ